MNELTRREFLRTSAQALAFAGAALELPSLLAQSPGERPPPAEGIMVLNPRARVPVGLIIDDSTCLVNLNRFAIPQFDAAFAGAARTYQRNWREWPLEIPDNSFVRKFGEWCAERGVKANTASFPIRVRRAA
jgi:hypothetical protein